MWICSAGYGLIPISSSVAPYSATFRTGDPDSVCRGQNSASQARQSWWQTLASWHGPQPGSPRTLAELARRNPDVPILVIASKDYLDAVCPDILEAARTLAGKELLSVLSAGAGSVRELHEHLLPCDARLQPAVGGALLSLNTRLASVGTRGLARATSVIPRDATIFAELGERLPQRAAMKRSPLTDAEVKKYISAGLEQNLRQRASTMLRQLRQGGTSM